MKVTMRPVRALPKTIIHRKVAAYCRVSTQQEIQHHSLEAQRYCAYAGRDSFAFSPTTAGENRGSPTSSRRRQQSTGLLHLIFRVPSSDT